MGNIDCSVFCLCEKCIDVVELNTGCIEIKENSTHSPGPIGVGPAIQKSDE